MEPGRRLSDMVMKKTEASIVMAEYDPSHIKEVQMSFTIIRTPMTFLVGTSNDNVLYFLCLP